MSAHKKDRCRKSYKCWRREIGNWRRSTRRWAISIWHSTTRTTSFKSSSTPCNIASNRLARRVEASRATLLRSAQNLTSSRRVNLVVRNSNALSVRCNHNTRTNFKPCRSRLRKSKKSSDIRTKKRATIARWLVMWRRSMKSVIGRSVT